MDTFRQLGLDVPEHMLLCSPWAYDDLRQSHTRWATLGEERVLIQTTMCDPAAVLAFTKDRQQQPVTPKDMRYTSLTRRLSIPLRDDSGGGAAATLSVFGNVWAWRDRAEGDPLTLLVTPRRFGRELYFQDAEIVNPVWVGRIRPRYRGIQGKVAAERIERDVLDVVDSPAAYEMCRDHILATLGCNEPDLMDRLLHQHGGPRMTLMGLLMNLHAPETTEDGMRAVAIAARISALGVQFAALERNVRRLHRAAPLSLDRVALGETLESFVPKLTADQRSVVTRIADRLTEPRPMNGLLTGDVGTGKTLAYLLPAIAAWQTGARVAIIAPTMILADQIAGEIAERFPDVHVARVRAGQPVSEPSAILVGTVGLINEAVRCDYVPNLLVIDEQHRLSAEQRTRIVKPWTHVLEVSATPIPRTVAIARYAGLEHFTLTQCPVDKDIWSGVLDASKGQREKINRWVTHAVSTGARALFVYPSVDTELQVAGAAAGAREGKAKGAGGRAGKRRAEADEQPSLELEQAEAARRATRSLLDAAAGIDEVFPDQVVVLHGQMSDDEKTAALRMFRRGERTIMVASSIVEIGVDLPDVRLAVVVGAERFGAAQLHQIRGRLARQGGKGAFAMFVEDHDRLPEDARARLAAVAQIRDGFELAERDLELRGFGQIDGIAQSGATDTIFRCQCLAPGDFFALADESPSPVAGEDYDETPVHAELPELLDSNFEGGPVTGDQMRLV